MSTYKTRMYPVLSPRQHAIAKFHGCANTCITLDAWYGYEKSHEARHKEKKDCLQRCKLILAAYDPGYKADLSLTNNDTTDT